MRAFGRAWRGIARRLKPKAMVAGILCRSRRAPSGGNWQPWDFVVVTEPGQRRALSAAGSGAGHVAGSTATIALVAQNFDGDQANRERARYDLGQATMAMMIAAADLGIGTAHAGVQDQPTARQALGVPQDRRVYYLIDLGYPADRPLRPIRRPNRRPFEQVVHWSRW